MNKYEKNFYLKRSLNGLNNSKCSFGNYQNNKEIQSRNKR